MKMPLPVRRLIAKLGFRLHVHVIQIGPNTYRKDGRAHWHRRTNPHYLR